MDKRSDRELLELLVSKVSSIETDIKDLKSDVKGLKAEVQDLKEGQNRIENKLDDIES